MSQREILLKQLFEAGNFQSLQDKLADALEIAIITVDIDGTPVSRHSGCSAFCAKVRKGEYSEFCSKCDSRGSIDASRKKKPFIYSCHMGLADIAIPIFVGGYYLGSVMAGQIRVTDPLERVTDAKNENHLPPQLIKEYDSLPLLSLKRVEALSEMLFSLYNYVTAEAAKKLSQESIPSHMNKPSPLLQPAVNYINSNYTTDIKLSALSEMCGISPSYFSKLFKKTYGEGVTAAINKMRVEKAKELLIKTKKTVGDIAYETGFDECGYFIKTFKKYTGVTPNSFRESFFLI